MSWAERDAAVVWHGFTQMASYLENEPIVVDRAEGRGNRACGVREHGSPLRDRPRVLGEPLARACPPQPQLSVQLGGVERQYRDPGLRHGDQQRILEQARALRRLRGALPQRRGLHRRIGIFALHHSASTARCGSSGSIPSRRAKTR